MKIAVTGASGHIGSVLIQELLDQGHELSLLVHKNHVHSSHHRFRIVNGSVLNPAAVHDLMSGCDAVIHTAAVISVSGKDQELIRSVNVEGTGVMFETAWQLKVMKFVHVSSIHAFEQRPSDIPLDENRQLVGPQAPAYDQSKRDGQLLALQYAEKGMNVSVVNPTSVVGPPDYRPSLMGQAIIGLANRTIPALIEGGFDFVDVRDVSRAISAAMLHGQPGACYLLSGKWHSIFEILETINKCSGSWRSLPVVPEWLARMGVPFIRLAAGLTGKAPLYTYESIEALVAGNRHIDSSKAKRDLGFAPREFSETIGDVYRWFDEHGYLKQ